MICALRLIPSIAFLWFGQALYPTFIAEMRRPQDFPKALAALTILQLVLFTITAAVGYHYMGQYATAPYVYFPSPTHRKGHIGLRLDWQCLA